MSPLLQLLALVALAQAPASPGDAAAGAGSALPEAGGEVTGTIGDAPAVTTPKLEGYRRAPTVGIRHRVIVAASGPYTIEMHSLDFDGYLVLLDAAGRPIAEDDDGYYGNNPRLVAELEGGKEYAVVACALHGERGEYRLSLAAGAAPKLDPRAAADRALDDARAAVERTEARRGETEELAEALNGLGYQLWRRARYAEALPVMERARAITDRSASPDDPERAQRIYQVAAQLQGLGRYDEALALYREALDFRVRVLGEDHTDTAWSRNNLGSLLSELGRYDEARHQHELALSIFTLRNGPEHTTTVMSMHNLGLALHGLGRLEDAEALFRRSLEILERTHKPEDSDTSTTLAVLAGVLSDQGKFAEARELRERSLSITERTRGPESPSYAIDLLGMAEVLRHQGEFAEALARAERALAIFEKTLPVDHPYTAAAHNDVGLVLYEQGRYRQALRSFELALQIHERRGDSESTNLARTLSTSASALLDLGEYMEARRRYERSLAIHEGMAGPNHPDTAVSLNNLAEALRTMGDLEAARPLFERALAIFEKSYDPRHRRIATCSNGLALVLFYQSKYDEARPYYDRSLDICESTYGPDHPSTADAMFNLARLLEYQGKHAEALPLFEKALSIQEKALDPDHPSLARGLAGVANSLRLLGRADEAQPFLERAITIEEKTLGPDNPSASNAIHMLAHLLAERGERERALDLHRRSVRMTESGRGAEFPLVISMKSCLVAMLLQDGAKAEAWQIATSVLEDSGSRFVRVLSQATESDALLYAEQYRRNLNQFLGIAAERPGPETAEACYRALLVGKGRVFRTHARARAELVASCTEGQRELADGLRAVQAALSNALAVREIPDRERHDRELSRLRSDCRRIEAELIAALADRGAEPEVSVAKISAALPEGAVLLDFFVHHHYRPEEREEGEEPRPWGWGPERLSVWVLRRGDTIPAWIDLGPSAPIERAVRDYLAVSIERGIGSTVPKGGPGAAAEETPGGRLRQLLWQPIEAQVGAASLVVVCPDRYLATLPWEILTAESGRYLVEDRGFVYLESPSLLLDRPPLARPRAPDDEPPTLLLAGAIDYDLRMTEPVEGEVAAASDRSSFEFDWHPLSGTRDEVDAIERLHEKCFEEGKRLTLRGAEATEERLKQEVQRASVVHLATHGYFEPEFLPSMRERLRESSAEAIAISQEERFVAGYLPGYLSGLVCAGANAPVAGRENGLFTAEEVAWLDLSGCDLVVLSACQTGLGESRSGEGLMSLRRAYRLAGARTVISSLWKVRDQSTVELMRSFYERRWKGGSGKLEALRGAQLELLERNRKKYGEGLPSTWGAFVLSGEWE